MSDSNLLITYDPSHKGRAEEEVLAALSSAGDEGKFIKSGVDGIFLLRTKENPKETVKKIFHECQADAGKFRYTFNWVPIEKWCSSSIGEMTKVMEEFNSRIDADKKWKIDINKRLNDKYTITDLIMKLTDKITKPNVDLKNPDIIVKVEIIGDRAGCSLLKKNELLSVPKIRA